jgi:hypothetical protein
MARVARGTRVKDEMMSDPYAGLLAIVQADPTAELECQVLADICEERGQDDLARGYRWMGREYKRPAYTSQATWVWYLSSMDMGSINLVHEIPSGVFRAMSDGPAIPYDGPYRYGTHNSFYGYENAVRALGRALAKESAHV